MNDYTKRIMADSQFENRPDPPEPEPINWDKIQYWFELPEFKKITNPKVKDETFMVLSCLIAAKDRIYQEYIENSVQIYKKFKKEFMKTSYKYDAIKIVLQSFSQYFHGNNNSLDEAYEQLDALIFRQDKLAE